MKNLIIGCLSLFISVNVFGWGSTGHRTVGLVAEKHLSAKAKKNIQKILGQNSLSEVANWMDEIRSDSTYDRIPIDWHWVTIETGKTYQESPKNPKGDVVAMLDKVISELKKHTLDKKTEEEYLRMLIHLVGDIHQPLHVGCCDDQGGNKVKVKWFGRETNLHSVWDSYLIDDTKLSYTELTNFLDEPDAATLAKWRKDDVLVWAYESMSFREQIYDVGGGSLSYKYSYKNLPLVKQRLLQAGIRLAAVLNEIYGK